MYDRRIDGRTLNFGHQGWLLNESFMFYDHETDSVWTQATGECLMGHWTGKKLTSVPATHTTWGIWKEHYPDTLVLEKPSGAYGRYANDGYTEYYAQNKSQFGLAVLLAEATKLYPLRQLRDTPVLHDEIAGRRVLIVYHAPSETAVAYQTSLNFSLAEIQAHDILIRESASGNRWSGLTGRSLVDSGRLDQLRTSQFTVSNFKPHYPAGLVHQRDRSAGRARTGDGSDGGQAAAPGPAEPADL